MCRKITYCLILLSLKKGNPCYNYSGFFFFLKPKTHTNTEIFSYANKILRTAKSYKVLKNHSNVNVYMNYFSYFLILALLFFVILLIFLSIKKHLQEIYKHQLGNQSDKLFEMLNQNMIGMQERIDKTTQTMNTRLDKAAQVIGQVNKELGSMSEIGRSLKDFQAFLNAPKLRGNIGEQILYDAINQVFSSHQYATQFKFKDGQIVDAVIKTHNALISIDSKFPMESFKILCEASTDEQKLRCRREFIKSVKKHIHDVSQKYILPQEGTVDFAVMYVPSENVYYEIVANNEELLEFARTQNVLLVSPNSFFHFLRVILMGLERTKIEEEAKKIWELLKSLQQETSKVSGSLQLVGRHLTNAKNAMDVASSEYAKFTSKIDQVRLIEKPQTKNILEEKSSS